MDILISVLIGIGLAMDCFARCTRMGAQPGIDNLSASIDTELADLTLKNCLIFPENWECVNKCRLIHHDEKPAQKK